MKIQILNEDGKSIISHEIILKNKEWESHYLIFWAKKGGIAPYIGQVAMGGGGYRLVKKRWYHRFFDAVSFPLPEGYNKNLDGVK